MTGIFAFEFTTRIAATHDRAGYLRGHWIDLVALVPPIRGARALRLLRLLRLVRALSGIYRAAGHARTLARHQGFLWLIRAWIGVMAVCSVWLYAAEYGINKTVESPFDAVWWGVVTLTTVGHGDVYPVTVEGRIAAITLMILGIGLFSTITATLASYLISIHRQPEPPESGLVADLERLQALRNAGAVHDTEFAIAKRRVLESQDGVTMLRIRSVEPLDGHGVRLTLTDGSVVGRDIAELLHGPVFEPIRSDEAMFRRVRVRRGTIVWPGGIDIDPDVLIWGGPAPADGRTPPPALKVATRLDSTRLGGKYRIDGHRGCATFGVRG